MRQQKIKMVCITYLFIIGVLFLFDQYSKYLVDTFLNLGQEITIIKNFFSLTYVKNYGAGFSILQNQQILFYILTPIALAAFIYFLIKAKTVFEKCSYLLLIGGTLGNFYDRIINAYVIDFLSFNFFGYHFPVFNLADCFLTIGVFMLFVIMIRSDKNGN